MWPYKWKFSLKSLKMQVVLRMPIKRHSHILDVIIIGKFTIMPVSISSIQCSHASTSSSLELGKREKPLQVYYIMGSQNFQDRNALTVNLYYIERMSKNNQKFRERIKAFIIWQNRYKRVTSIRREYIQSPRTLLQDNRYMYSMQYVCVCVQYINSKDPLI